MLSEFINEFLPLCVFPTVSKIITFRALCDISIVCIFCPKSSILSDWIGKTATCGRQCKNTGDCGIMSSKLTLETRGRKASDGVGSPDNQFFARIAKG
jgi:hypothetical protein